MIARHPTASRRFTTWKNGGGETAEIVCQPEGAGFDDFQWRISTARVAASGPFSAFPGVMRSLTVLEGGPMVLRFAGTEILASPDAGPIAFRGDVDVHADLIGPPLLDLNVMTRAPFESRVRCASAPRPRACVRSRRAIFSRCPTCRCWPWNVWTLLGSARMTPCPHWTGARR